MSNYYKIFFALLIFPLWVFAQNDTTFSATDYLIEILDESKLDEESSELLEYIEQLLDNPVDLNNATIQGLLVIPNLSPADAQKIVEHRSSTGRFFSLLELNAVDGLNEETIRRIKPFLTIGAKRTDEPPGDKIQSIPFKNFISIRSRLQFDLQDRKGFIDKKYAGSKYKTYTRIAGAYDLFQFSGISEKDPGEKSAVDFLSFSLSLSDYRFISKAAAGDYYIEFGQGLAMWGPYGFSKGSEATSTIIRKNRNIIPYTSADENRFFRGSAAELQFDQFLLSIYFSSKHIDANIENGLVFSLPRDGYHRTDSEVEKRNSLHERMIGSKFAYVLQNKFNAEFIIFNSTYSKEFSAKNAYSLKGKSFNFYSISFNALFGSLYLAGEAAYNGKYTASILNAHAELGKNLRIILSFRNYDKGYANLYANGFGESTGTQNEIGFYAGMKWKTNYGMISFYFDQFKFPGPTFSNPLPVSGNEFLINYRRNFSGVVEFNAFYIIENKEVTITQSNKKDIFERFKKRIRGDLTVLINPQVKIKSRLEILNLGYDLTKQSESGFLSYHELRVMPLQNLWLNCRIVFFQTDSYDSRVYQFENDLSGVMSNPPLFGKGIRWYFLIKYEIFNKFFLTVKYSELYKPDEKTLSSGFGEILNNLDNKFGLQLDYSF